MGYSRWENSFIVGRFIFYLCQVEVLPRMITGRPPRYKVAARGGSRLSGPIVNSVTGMARLRRSYVDAVYPCARRGSLAPLVGGCSMLAFRPRPHRSHSSSATVMPWGPVIPAA